MHTLQELQDKFSEVLESQYFDFEPNELYAPMTYTLGLGGKRLRPVLALLACDMFDGDLNKVMMPAIGIELFHNFTLIHDDIMDNAPIRRGKPTVYRKWNSSVAILSGDAMFVKAYEFVALTEKEKLSEIFDIFNKVALQVCEGQQFDMNFETQNDVSKNEYINMIWLKTAVLLAASLQIGAVIGGATREESTNLYKFGQNIGIAFQLKDDLLDVFSDEDEFGKMNGGDIITNKKTYLYIRAFEKAEGEIKEALTAAFKINDDQEKIKTVTALYNQLNIKQETQTEIDKYYEDAIKYLGRLNIEDERKSEVLEFAENLKNRTV